MTSWERGWLHVRASSLPDLTDTAGCGLRVCAWVEHALELAIEGIVLVVPRGHQIQVPALICLAP